MNDFFEQIFEKFAFLYWTNDFTEILISEKTNEKDEKRTKILRTNENYFFLIDDYENIYFIKN